MININYNYNISNNIWEVLFQVSNQLYVIQKI